MTSKQLSQKSCNVNGCEGNVIARGLCTKHYKRFMRLGTTDCAQPNYSTPEEAFEARTQFEPMSGCLIWTGSTIRGYGRIQVDGKTVRAHRYAWERENGPIPAGMFICHHCDTPACCKESHLFLGSHQDNMSDMCAKNRQAKLKGSQHGRAKLTEADIPKIRADPRLHRIIAADYGVDQSAIRYIKNRKTWNHIK